MGKPLFGAPDGAPFPIMQLRTTYFDGRVKEDEPRGSEQMLRVGKDALTMIRDALRAEPLERKVRAVAECMRMLPKETGRCPEVCELFEYLARHGQTGAISRILGERGGRGRPPTPIEDLRTQMAIVEGILDEVGSVSRAAMIARTRHPREFGHLTPRRIENLYCEHRDAYQLWKQERWLPSELLADPWTLESARKRRA